MKIIFFSNGLLGSYRNFEIGANIKFESYQEVRQFVESVIKLEAKTSGSDALDRFIAIMKDVKGSLEKFNNKNVQRAKDVESLVAKIVNEAKAEYHFVGGSSDEEIV